MGINYCGNCGKKLNALEKLENNLLNLFGIFGLITWVRCRGCKTNWRMNYSLYRESIIAMRQGK